MHSIKLKLARIILKAEPFLHPRIFSLLLKRLWPFLRMPHGFVPACYGPIEMRLDLRDSAERQGFLHTYDPPLIQFVERHCRSGDVVIDIGANAGIISATAAKCVGPSGQVIAIEPNPVLAARLKDLAKRNPLANIHVLEMALGEHECELPFYISSAHPFSTLDAKYLPDYPLKGVVTVRVCTLDKITSQFISDKGIRLLKIDAQGYENRILKSATSMLANTPPDLIVIEAVSNGFTDVMKNIHLAGYGLFSFADIATGLEPREIDYLPPESSNVVLIHNSVLNQFNISII